MSNRREFIVQFSLGSSMLAAGSAFAETALVVETEAPAAALGYKADAGKVDKAKNPKFAADQKCGNCALYQGKTAATGPCPLFPGKHVSAKGWCTGWAKKA
jgi:hypothetical protein